MNYLTFSFFSLHKKLSPNSPLFAIALSVLILHFSPVPSFASVVEIAPDRDIDVVQNIPQTPDWKILWDAARALARDGEIHLAADGYAQLFKVKPNIEEANWEYCKILLEIGSFDVASTIVSLLLENSPNNSDYLLAAAQVAAYRKKYVEAENYFGRILEKDPGGNNSDQALLGLAESLRSRGLFQFSFPLLRQLYVRQPENRALLQMIAEDAAALNHFDLARDLYAQLIEKGAGDEILFQAVAFYDKAGFVEERDALKRSYLEKHPEHLPFRLSLMKGLEASGEYEKVLVHLQYLIKHADPIGEYLKNAAEIAENQLGRQDRALVFLEQYKKVHHGDETVSANITRLQEKMALELLVIAENGGVAPLWDDLEELGNSRVVIFYQMADLLKAGKKTEPYISILETLYAHGHKSPETSLALAKYYQRKKEYSKSLDYLLVLPENYHDEAYFLQKGDLEFHLGREVAALGSYRNYLQFEPGNRHVRQKAIELSGGLGFVQIQQKLFSAVEDENFSTVPNDLLLTHIRMLSLNRLFGKALDLCDRAIFAHLNRMSRLDFYLAKTHILRSSGQMRRAEQLLRQMLNEKELQHFALLQLVDNAIADHRIERARTWYDQISQFDAGNIQGKQLLQYRERAVVIEARLYLVEGHADKALTLIEETIEDFLSTSKGSKESQFHKNLLAEKYRLYLTLGDIVAADSLINKEGVSTELPAELLATRSSFRDPASQGGEEGAVDSLWGSSEAIPYSHRLTGIESEVMAQKYQEAGKYLQEIKKDLKDSVRLKNIELDIAQATGRNRVAETLAQELELMFPAESGFCRTKLEIIAKSGRHEDAINGLTACYPDYQTQFRTQRDNESVEIELFNARLLWGNKQYEDALALYGELLEPPVYKLLIEQFSAQNLDYQYLNREQTFWSSIMLISESDPEIIAELMEPTFIVHNWGSVTGKIVADNYEMFSWQSLISDEFLARKAIFNKNYHFAAKSYEKLIEQEETTENKVDLATIYSRIGEYRKEAQVYEDISEEGEVSPEVKESIARNFLQIRPTVSLVGDLEEREGREGVVDIRKTALGTTFWFTPALNKDFWLEYGYNVYKSTNRVQETSSNRIFGSMSWDFSDNYELIAALGTEKFTDSSNSEPLYTLQLKGQLDDYVAGFITFQKEPVDDSVASLEDNINRRFIQTGLSMESELGITFGGDIQYSLYNDDNERNRLYLFSSYSIFGDSLRLDMQYSYQYLTNKDINGPEGIFSEDANNDIIKSYWSPENYSEHRLGLQLKKDFFGNLTDVENRLSYFLIDAGLSLEDEENVGYSTRFDIFLEMSPHLLLKGNFSFHSSDVYDEKLLSLSLHYSW